MPTAQPALRLSLNEIRRRAAQFAVDYRDATQERSQTADFWKALLRCYGIEDSYLRGVEFERPARRADTGRPGRIDVFKPGRYLIEQKTTGRIVVPRGQERSNAEAQAHAYLHGGEIPDHEMPRYVVTCDFRTFQITDLEKSLADPQRHKTFLLADLAENVEALLFLTGEDDHGTLLAQEQAQASVEAARLMANLYEVLTGDADTDEEAEDAEDEDAKVLEVSILLTRLLFLMFGDDAGLWRTGMFQRFIETRTVVDGSDLGPKLSSLFDVLDTPASRRSDRIDEDMAAFPYVNGAVFRRDQNLTMWFDQRMREALLEACRFDWSKISPAVFGSLFQAVKKKEARRAEGEHYTSEANILKTLGPMFLDDFKARLNAARTKPALEALHADLRNFRYVDPACGCGNFLIVAYREMRALELELLNRLRQMRREGDLEMDPSHMLTVRLDQFYGIEINWWPAKIAETAMFLVDHQANQQMARVLGLTPERLPIDIEANITHTNALTADWADFLPGSGVTVFVFGNPPFLGRKTTSATQKRQLADAWQTSATGHLDFVTAWHAKTIAYLADKQGEFGFVTTNSICQGEPVGDLFPRLEDAGWKIKFAHRTFAWDSEAAARDRAGVHCVVVGFTRDEHTKPRLFTYATVKSDPEEIRGSTSINGYLVNAPNVYVSARTNPLSPALPKVSFGSMPRDGGNLLVSEAEYDEVAADPVAAKYLRPFVGADELIKSKKRWCLWMADDDFDPADVSRSTVLRARLAKVSAMRSDSKADTTRAWASSPHLFVQQAQPTVPYMCIPRHFSEHRLWATVARFAPDVIAGDSTFTCPDPDGFGFAIISSSMFITWQKTVGGRLESRPRFSKDIVWNTLPLPEVSATDRATIAAAGQAVLDARAQAPTRSLAEHYQPLAMARPLVTAHEALDRVVDKAFGAGRRRTMDEVARQKVLFERYAEMTAQA